VICGKKQAKLGITMHFLTNAVRLGQEWDSAENRRMDRRKNPAKNCAKRLWMLAL